jgi:polysaccharide pyruvyl transferase WcaK-like protein
VTATSIFVNPTGQVDNLGDSVLRRPYLAALRGGGQLHVLNTDGPDYSSALGILSADIVYTSRRRWFTAAAREVFMRRGVFALNAGEIVTGSGYARRASWQYVLATIAAVGNGKVIGAGIGLRAPSEKAPALLRAITRRASLLSWRDAESQDSAQVGEVNPDWAFMTGSDVRPGLVQRRSIVCIALRGDRPPPSREWITALYEWARTSGYELKVIVQVRRDATLAAQLASNLGCELVDWPDHCDHAAQERVVREVYARSVAVMSDRIHALILGLTEGASPIGVSTTSTEKSRRIFAAISDLAVADVLAETDEPSRWSSLVAARDQAIEDLRRARVTLTNLESQLAIGSARDQLASV